LPPDAEDRTPEDSAEPESCRPLIRPGFVVVLVSVLFFILLLILAPARCDYPPPPSALAKDAQEEIRSIELGCTGLLRDAGQPDFFSLFTDLAAMRESYATDQLMWTEVVHDLLQNGKNAKCDLKPEVRERLGSSYLELGKDPWGNLYQVHPGPWTRTSSDPIPFRSYRGGTGDLEGGVWTPYLYDAAAKSQRDAETPGNPDPDNRPGFPAPLDHAVYIYSFGPNMLDDQDWGDAVEMGYEGGGDDINNWDPEVGWTFFYQW
jgi:hypothetical protein